MRNLIATVLLAGSVGACATTPAPGSTASSPRAYVIAEINVTDPTGYQEYLAAISPIVDRFGGTYLVRGGKTLQIEGAEPSGRVVVIAFPSLSAAQAFESAPESLAAAAIRHRTATSRIYVVEGASP